MLLTITTTHTPATDLSFLLHKRPDRVQQFPLNFGTAHVFYPERSEERCTVALLIDVDPVGLVRNRRFGGDSGLMDQYVNDRPFAASSFLSVAISKVFASALAGKSDDRADLADTPIPLRAVLPVVRARGGEEFIRALFAPLGYEVTVTYLPFEETVIDATASPYYSLELFGTVRLKELLQHLYVLIPVIDNEKHYWVAEDEIEKLLRHGKGWLSNHPQNEKITRRYLKHKNSLTKRALAQLLEESDVTVEDTDEAGASSGNSRSETAIEEPLRLNDLRMQTVVEASIATEAVSVLDLGCGEGKLLHHLIKQKQFQKITGMDVSMKALEMAADRLKLDRLSPSQQSRIQLLHGSLIYRDRRLTGYDLATVIEVIEHMEPDRLPSFERLLFGWMRPRSIIITTPNSEYNVLFQGLVHGKMRHADHRFEWNRQVFQQWSNEQAEKYGYTCSFSNIGVEHEQHGSPTQMALFQRVAP